MPGIGLTTACPLDDSTSSRMGHVDIQHCVPSRRAPRKPSGTPRLCTAGRVRPAPGGAAAIPRDVRRCRRSAPAAATGLSATPRPCRRRRRCRRTRRPRRRRRAAGPRGRRSSPRRTRCGAPSPRVALRRSMAVSDSLPRLWKGRNPCALICDVVLDGSARCKRTLVAELQRRLNPCAAVP